MRYERTGRTPHEIVEVWEGPTRCDGCGGVLAAPHVHLGWTNCDCAGGPGHSTKRCLDCNQQHYDPPCVRPRAGGSNAYGF